jgi:ABC-2 type transport system ATP-binding protein
MIQFEQVAKSYGDQPILRAGSLQLNKGIYWLQGINGSGKTTLLRILAGLVPFEGDILFEGISLRHKPLVYRRNLSLAESEPLYPPFITGQELLTFYKHVRKASLPQIEKLIALFSMQEYLSMPIGSYSSGMTKKLSLVLAFIGNCPLILLDEPLATLDEEAAVLLPQLLVNYQREFGSSFIFSSHQSIKTDPLSVDRKLVIADQTIRLA